MRYPEYTGSEPCAQLGTTHYYVDIEGRGGSYNELPLLRDLCQNRCFMYTDCLNWAVRHEQYGFWAGTTESERQRIRARRNIILLDPMYGGETRRTA